MPSRWAALRQLRVPLANCSRDAKWDSVRVFPNGKSIRRELITQASSVRRGSRRHEGSFGKYAQFAGDSASERFKG